MKKRLRMLIPNLHLNRISATDNHNHARQELCAAKRNRRQKQLLNYHQSRLAKLSKSSKCSLDWRIKTKNFKILNTIFLMTTPQKKKISNRKVDGFELSVERKSLLQISISH